MSSQPSTQGRPAGGAQHLKHNAMGPASIVFLVVAAAAPLAVIVAIAPLVFGVVASPGVAGTFLVAAIILLLFSVGYAAMSRFVSGPGGFAVYVARAFGPSYGGATAAVAMLSYFCVTAALAGLFGSLAQPLFLDKLSIDLSWWVWSLAALVIVAVLGYRSVDVSAKVLGVFLIAETLVILIMNFGILFNGGRDGVNFHGFEPSNVFGGGFGVVLLLAFASWLGFEATTIYGEEARDRHRTIPRATYAAVLIIGGFYVFTFWVVGLAYGTGIVSIATKSPETLIFDMGTKFVGSAIGDTMNWLVVTSLFASLLAFHNSLSRYMFALGRNGLFPKRFGKVHPKHASPYVAGITQTILIAAIVLLFAIIGADPYLDLYAWFIGVGTVGVIVLYLAASISVIRYLRVEGNDPRLWQSVVAPLLATAGLIAAIYLAIDHFDLLTGSTSDIVNALWVLIPIAAVGGFAVARTRYRNLGPEAFEEGLRADLDSAAVSETHDAPLPPVGVEPGR